MARKGKSIAGGYKGGSAAGSSRSSRGGTKKPPLTHFLCIPLVTDVSKPQISAALNQFRELVAEENRNAFQSRAGIIEASTVEVPLKAIRPIGTIHFTLGVMSLTSDDRVAEAIGFLQTLDLEHLMQQDFKETQKDAGTTSRPLRMSLTSLHSMHTPKNTSILYAGPDDSNLHLLLFCNRLRDAFSSAGFLVPDDRPLKLHATILNTIYANPGGRASQSNMRIDAANILDKCRNYVWAADFPLEKIAICRMGAKKITDDEGTVIDEEYEEIASISLSV